MVMLVPIAGEFKFYPLHDQFRVSFGPTVFFFLLLFLSKNRIVLAGLITGISVYIFRLVIDGLVIEPYDFSESFFRRFPALFYYIIYSFVFYLFKVKFYYQPVLLIGILGMFTEITAQAVELTIQYYLIGAEINLESVWQIAIIAIFRSFFVVSFYSMIVLYESKIREEEIKNKNEHLLLLLSSLYEERIHIKKTLKNAEKITKESYEVYRSLKQEEISKEDRIKLAERILKVAGDIHDIKKDNQRIYAGLSKLISSEKFSDFMYMGDLLQIIVNSNRKYALSLGKKIDFIWKTSLTNEKFEVFLLLSLLNNLVANSIEAIDQTGEIIIEASGQQDIIIIEVLDSGSGIQDKYAQIIYKPGFSLKFNQDGSSSSGLGLSYSKEIIRNYGGELYHQSIENRGTKFTIEIPKAKLIKGQHNELFFSR